MGVEELVRAIERLKDEVRLNEEVTREGSNWHELVEEAILNVVKDAPEAFDFTVEAGLIVLEMERWRVRIAGKREVPEKFKRLRYSRGLSYVVTLDDFVDSIPALVEKLGELAEEQRRLRAEVAEILERVKAALGPLVIADKMKPEGPPFGGAWERRHTT
jgi:hypothetical protein